jgi:hypothetical protein
MPEGPIRPPAGVLSLLFVAVLASCSGLSGAAEPGSCGSTGAVDGCTLILSGGKIAAAACEVQTAATSSGGLEITITAGGDGATYPVLDAGIVLLALPEADQTYSTADFASSFVVARTTPTAQWAARYGNGDDFGAVQLVVNEYSGAVVHGNVTALLVGETTGGVLSACAVF